jgi:hypothetical protein
MNRNPIMNRKTVMISIGLGLIIGLIGCATPSPHHTDAEMELAQRHAEDATLQRLAASSCSDIADAAQALAQEGAQANR